MCYPFFLNEKKLGEVHAINFLTFLKIQYKKFLNFSFKRRIDSWISHLQADFFIFISGTIILAPVCLDVCAEKT